jgi:hypothetical protein
VIRAAAAVLAAAVLITAALASPASAATDLRVPTTRDKRPVNHRLTANQAIAIANRTPEVREEKRKYPDLRPVPYLKGPSRWQVSYFHDSEEKAQVIILDATGTVTEAWTGFRVRWTMARGRPGAFGREVTALYIWIPLCILFVLPFVDPRRPFRMLHLDLLVLVGMSISLGCFTRGWIEWSVPLLYPVLLYLLARMLWLARRGGPPDGPLKLLVPVRWMAVALLFLVGFRIGLNVTDSNVIDVGYSGVIGADKLLSGEGLYGDPFHADNQHGDTYGPFNYLAYVPFTLIFGWGGSWDSLPAAHAASIAFDVLTIAALFVLGWRLRGVKLGVALAYAWAAFPFTIFALETNANDSLVALLLVGAFALIASPAGRGAMTALAGLTKFGPLALVPLLAVHPGIAARGAWKRVAVFALAFAALAAVVMLPVWLQGDLGTFFERTVKFQADRDAPFSVWGLYGLPGGLQLAVQIAAVVLAIGAAILPRRRNVIQAAALGAAILIASQLGLTYWFYLYVVWFFPLVMLVLLGRHGDPPPAASPPRETLPAREPAPA